MIVAHGVTGNTSGFGPEESIGRTNHGVKRLKMMQYEVKSGMICTYQPIWISNEHQTS